jgi:hypothetical protein
VLPHCLSNVRAELEYCLFGGFVTALAAVTFASPLSAHAAGPDPLTVDQLTLTVDQLTLTDGQVTQRTPVTVQPQVSRFRPAAAPAPARPATVSGRLTAMAAATPGARVRVTVTLRNDRPVPRFPSLAPGESLTSPNGTAALAASQQLVEQIRAGHAADYAAWRDRIAALGGRVDKDFWLFKGFTAEVPLSAVPQIAANPQVQYVEPAANPNPVRADTDAGNNNIVVARTLLGSEPYRQFARTTDRIGLVDSGVNGHVLINGVVGSVFDDSGEKTPSGTDVCNHGTRSVAALAGNSSLTDQFRGVTSMKVNVYKFTATVYDGEQINLPFNLAATGCRLSVSLWWPESLNSDHNDVDLHIFHPSGTTWRRATAPTASGSSPGSPVGSSVAPGSSR